MNDYKEEYDEKNNEEEKGYSPFDSPSLSPSIISQPTNTHTPYRKTATLLIENSKLQLIGMSEEEKRWIFNSYKWYVKYTITPKAYGDWGNYRVPRVHPSHYKQATLDFLLTLSTLDDLLDAIKSGVYMTYMNTAWMKTVQWDWRYEIFYTCRRYTDFPPTENQIHYVGFRYMDMPDFKSPRLCPKDKPRNDPRCDLKDPSTLNFMSFNPDYVLGHIHYEFSPPHEHYISSSGKEYEEAKSMDKSGDSIGVMYLNHELLREVAKKKPYAYFLQRVCDDKGDSEVRMYYWN